MERMEAVKPARGDPHGSKTRRRAPPSQATTAVEGKGPEPLTSDRPGLRPTFCPREEQPLTPMAPQSSGAQGLQFQGSSVLESKVRALKEKMASKRGAEPRPISHEQSSSKRLECHQVRAGALRGDRPLPEAAVVPCAERLTDQRPGSSVSEDRGSRSPRLPSPGPDRWDGQSPRPPEAEWTPPDHGKDSPLGPGCSQDSPVHQVTAGGPQGPWKPPRMPRLQERRPCPLRDALDSPALTSEEDVGPGSALLRALWRTGHQGPLDTEDDVLSLSDRVERNRLLLKEMLKKSRQNPPEVGSPTGTPSWDRAALERPAGDVDWDSGTPLQDSGQSRTFAPKPEPVPSARHEEAKHLLQRARMKARTQPLRASHDIVPTIVQGNRNGQRNPAPDARMTSPCRDSPQNGNLSDSSSGESSSGQWPKRDLPLSHVRFEDESVCEAEFRYLQRLQQRQRPVLSTVLQAVGQGPLRSKPDLTHYINRDARDGAFHRPLGSLDHSSDPAPPPTWDSERKCQACGNCLEKPRSAEGRSADLRTLQDLQAAYGAVLLEPCSSCGLSLEFPFLLPEPELHTEWAGETHIRDPVVTCPKEGSSALDSTSTSDSCWMDSEEAGTCRPSKPGRRAQSSSLQQQQQDARPHGGHGWSRTAVMEQLQGLHDCPHLVGADVMVLGEEEKGDIRHMSQKTRFPSRDVPKLPTVEPEEPPLGSRGQPGPGLNSHQAHPGDSWAPRSTASTVTSSMELGPSGSGRLDQFTDCRKSLETACTSSLQPNHTELSTPHPALQPASPVSSEHWMPTPLSSRKSPCPVPPKKPARTGRRRQELQAEPVDALLPCSSPRTTALSPPQAHPCSPPVKPRRLDQPTNSCSKHAPLGLKEPQGAAAHEGMLEREPCYQEPGRPPKSHEDGTFQVAPGSADLTTVNFAAITVSLTSEEPESTREPVGGRQREESSSGGHTPPGAPPVAHAGPRPPSDGNKKRNNSIVSTLGLKKLFSALGHTSQTKLGTPRSFSVEQLQSAAPASHTSTHKVKRAPSLQSLRLVSPSHQHRKATSFQNLHSLLSGKGDRSSLYLVEGSGKPTASGRPARAPPRRALSVEDVSAPSLARTVGRVVEVFPDGTSQLQLQRPPEGTFGFCVAYGNGHRDSGLYVQAMANRDTAKLYSGLLGVGDEILEVNGAKVAGLSLAHIKELLAHMESLSIRVLRQRVIAQ